MTNDEAVRVLREVVQKPGPIKLVVAKCWDPNPKGKFIKGLSLVLFKFVPYNNILITTNRIFYDTTY